MVKIVFSHGFGVRADSLGMFPEIAEALPDYESIMFDYNELSASGDVFVPSLFDQAATLRSEIDAAGDKVILICHSQGSVVAGLIDLINVKKVVLLAPPTSMTPQHVGELMRLKKPDCYYDMDGNLLSSRRNGGTLTLSKEYLASVDEIEPLDLYEKLANERPTLVIRATDDEVLGLTDLAKIPAKHVDIKADHNFNALARELMVQEVKSFIVD